MKATMSGGAARMRTPGYLTDAALRTLGTGRAYADAGRDEKTRASRPADRVPRPTLAPSWAAGAGGRYWGRACGRACGLTGEERRCA